MLDRVKGVEDDGACSLSSAQFETRQAFRRHHDRLAVKRKMPAKRVRKGVLIAFTAETQAVSGQ